MVRGRRTEGGAAALEFALVAPVILLFIFGIIQYGYLFWSLETASATAREAARQLIVGTDQQCVKDQAAGQAAQPAVGATPPQVAVAYTDPDGAASASPVVGGLVTVTVSFESLDLHLPLLPVPDGGTVSGDGSARVENIPAVPLAC